MRFSYFEKNQYNAKKIATLIQPTAQYITYSRNNLDQGYSSLTNLDILFTSLITIEYEVYGFEFPHNHSRMSQVSSHLLLQ